MINDRKNNIIDRIKSFPLFPRAAESSLSHGKPDVYFVRARGLYFVAIVFGSKKIFTAVTSHGRVGYSTGYHPYAGRTLISIRILVRQDLVAGYDNDD